MATCFRALLLLGFATSVLADQVCTGSDNATCKTMQTLTAAKGDWEDHKEGIEMLQIARPGAPKKAKFGNGVTLSVKDDSTFLQPLGPCPRQAITCCVKAGDLPDNPLLASFKLHKIKTSGEGIKIMSGDVVSIQILGCNSWIQQNVPSSWPTIRTRPIFLTIVGSHIRTSFSRTGIGSQFMIRKASGEDGAIMDGDDVEISWCTTKHNTDATDEAKCARTTRYVVFGLSKGDWGIDFRFRHQIKDTPLTKFFSTFKIGV